MKLRIRDGEERRNGERQKIYEKEEKNCDSDNERDTEVHSLTFNLTRTNDGGHVVFCCASLGEVAGGTHTTCRAS